MHSGTKRSEPGLLLILSWRGRGELYSPTHTPEFLCNSGTIQRSLPPPRAAVDGGALDVWKETDNQSGERSRGRNFGARGRLCPSERKAAARSGRLSHGSGLDVQQDGAPPCKKARAQARLGFPNPALAAQFRGFFKTQLFKSMF